MSRSNRTRPHVLILPEDSANRKIAIGFSLGVDDAALWQIQVLNPAGGWLKVFDSFENEHVSEMRRFPNRFLVLVIDFDKDENRRGYVASKVPADLVDRVFVLGAFSEPERLKDRWGRYEKIGQDLAEDCRDNKNASWSHELLCHNAAELERLGKHVRPILFP